MNKNTLLLTIVFALFLPSCKSTKRVQTAVEPPTPSTDVVGQSTQQHLNFEWFAANLSGTSNFAGDRNSFGGQIRIQNGEKVWMTITALGFYEVARLLITTDSVFIYNRHEKTAIIRDYSFFKEMTGMDLTFDMLQDILLGNSVLPESSGRQLSVHISYENHAMFNEHLYPQSIFLQMTNPFSMELRLNYQRIQINVPQTMPFSIPESIKRN